MRILPLIAAVSIAALPTLAQAQSRTPQPAQVPAPAADHDGAHDFDFLIGNWKAHLRQLEKPLTGSTTWTEYDGISRTHKVLDTNANLEEFEVTSAATGKHKKGQTLRLYNPETHEWSLYLIYADQGLLPQPATVGKFANGKGEFYDMELWNGRTILVRYQWTPSTTAPRMEQAFSVDGGRTWEVNWICELTPE